ncbi:hypothetical protein TNCV_3197461 [Trichonephila clavipes]|nr:hypothetical protein TNCV_3197461 [Trichonephila clavipes]
MMGKEHHRRVCKSLGKMASSCASRSYANAGQRVLRPKGLLRRRMCFGAVSYSGYGRKGLFDSKGFIHKTLIPKSTTLNDVPYAEILKPLLQRIRRVRLEYAKQGSWTLLPDNAWPHIALVVRQILATNGVVTLDHPLIHLIWYLQTSSSSPDFS